MTSDTFKFKKPNMLNCLWKVITGHPRTVARSPNMTLDVDSWGCWPLARSEGTLGIALARNISISHVLVKHFPGKTNSAPREIEIWLGLSMDGRISQGIHLKDSHFTYHLPTGEVRSHVFFFAGSIRYNAYALEHEQHFSLPMQSQLVGDTVLWRIKDNWGNQNYTL